MAKDMTRARVKIANESWTTFSTIMFPHPLGF